MKTRTYSIAAACITILAAMLACNAPTAAPTVSNIRMTTDETGQTSTTSYSPINEFYVFADLNGLSPGSLVEAKWYVVSAEGLDPNSMINASDYTYESGVRNVYFQLSTSDGGDWPTGTYRVEMYLDGTKVGEQSFTVE